MSAGCCGFPVIEEGKCVRCGAEQAVVWAQISTLWDSAEGISELRAGMQAWLDAVIAAVRDVSAPRTQEEQAAVRNSADTLLACPKKWIPGMLLCENGHTLQEQRAAENPPEIPTDEDDEDDDYPDL